MPPVFPKPLLSGTLKARGTVFQMAKSAQASRHTLCGPRAPPSRPQVGQFAEETELTETCWAVGQACYGGGYTSAPAAGWTGSVPRTEFLVILTEPDGGLGDPCHQSWET